MPGPELDADQAEVIPVELTNVADISACEKKWPVPEPELDAEHAGGSIDDDGDEDDEFPAMLGAFNFCGWLAAVWHLVAFGWAVDVYAVLVIVVGLSCVDPIDLLCVICLAVITSA